jgi:gliding motility-associated-like protein
LLNSSVGSQTDVDCNGNSTGSVTISPSGSTPPYQYSIDNGVTWQSSPTFNGLTTGPYNIIVRDTNGCTITQGVTIGQPAVSLSATSSAVIAADCNGASTGSLTASAVGGTAPYQYSLDNSPLQPSGLFNGLASGTYTVTATDANGCTSSFNVTITEPAPLNLAANSGSIPAPCGTNDGVAYAVPTGGTQPFTYAWTGTPLQTDSVDVPPGTYTVTVTDANGCEIQLAIIVVEDSCDFGMPDGFSPNGDGRNDDFEVRGTDKYPDNILIVFNRWGNQVYSKEDYTGHEWKGDNDKGDPLPEGTYFVVFSAIGSDFKANTFVDLRR